MQGGVSKAPVSPPVGGEVSSGGVCAAGGGEGAMWQGGGGGLYCNPKKGVGRALCSA